MTRPCKIGVQLPEVERFVPWPEYLDLARRAEAVGYDSVWVGDHLIYDLPDGVTRGPYESWTTLAAILASRPGGWKPAHATSGPSSTRSVTAARAESSVHASHGPRSGCS